MKLGETLTKVFSFLNLEVLHYYWNDWFLVVSGHSHFGHAILPFVISWRYTSNEDVATHHCAFSAFIKISVKIMLVNPNFETFTFQSWSNLQKTTLDWWSMTLASSFRCTVSRCHEIFVPAKRWSTLSQRIPAAKFDEPWVNRNFKKSWFQRRKEHMNKK